MKFALLPLILGYGMDLLLGDPPGLPHPVVWIGRLIDRLEKTLRPLFPKTPAGELAGGAVLVFGVLAVTGGLSLPLLWAAGLLSPWLRLGLETVLCWQILSTKALGDESMRVYKALKTGGLGDARRAVSMIVGRDTENLDEAGVIRAAVETVAENTADGIVAPLFYCALGGPWLGLVYKAVNTMDSMIAYKNDKYLYFGRVAAHLDDAANWLPARLAALIMIAVSPLAGGNGREAARIWRRDRRRHKSPNSAQTESVCAGALGIRLAGDAVYGGVLVQKPTIGDETRPIESEDIPRACRLMAAASMGTFVLALLGRWLVTLSLGGI